MYKTKEYLLALSIDIIMARQREWTRNDDPVELYLMNNTEFFRKWSGMF